MKTTSQQVEALEPLGEQAANVAVARALHALAKAVGATGRMVYTAELVVSKDGIDLLRPCLSMGWPSKPPP